MQSLSIEITLLQLLKYRERYERLAKAVPKAALEAKSVVFLDDFGKFFKEFPDIQRIDFEPFMLWFKAFAHPTLTAEQMTLYRALLDPVLNQECEPSLEAGILERLLAAEAIQNLTDLIGRWGEGAEIDVQRAIQTEMGRWEHASTRKIRMPWDETDIEEILQDDKDDRGLHWRLACLNRVMRALRPGDFIILAGRPDRGKTTWASSEVTFMAPQLDAMWPGEEREVIWLNNEGPGKRIIGRNFQSALDLTTSEMIELSGAGLLKQLYADAVGGANRIRVMNIHGFDSYEVEAILNRCNPGLIVFDMVDNIKFGGKSSNGGERTDQILEAMYQWARLLGVKHDSVVIATSQTSSAADGIAYPTQPMLKDSQTGKQGAADAIVTMGMVNDPAYVNSRFIGVTKSMLRREGQPQSPHCEVYFDGDHARLRMPTENA